MIGKHQARYATSLANMLSVHLLRHYATAADGGPLTASVQRDHEQSDTKASAVAASRCVAQALQFIQENYARNVGLSDIAAAVQVSPFHLSRRFKQALGVSPYQHLIQVRVDSARHLLAAGSVRGSLAEIASAVGFADQSHLSRHFKRLTGVAPGQFRAYHARSR